MANVSMCILMACSIWSKLVTDETFHFSGDVSLTKQVQRECTALLCRSVFARVICVWQRPDFPHRLWAVLTKLQKLVLEYMFPSDSKNAMFRRTVKDWYVCAQWPRACSGYATIQF